VGSVYKSDPEGRVSGPFRRSFIKHSCYEMNVNCELVPREGDMGPKGDHSVHATRTKEIVGDVELLDESTKHVGPSLHLIKHTFCL